MKFRLQLVRWLALFAGMLLLAGCGKKKEEVAAVVEGPVEILDPSVVEALVKEERQLEKIRKGLKAKFYRRTRGGLVKGLLGVIGAVEGQSAHPLVEKLPVEVRSMISAADGEAGKLKEMAEKPPAEVGLVIATGYLVHLQKTPALCELELIDAESFRTPGGESGFRVVRGVTYFMHGLKQHGLRDLREANVGSAEALAPEVRTAIYLGAAAAAIAADEPRMSRTQLELAEEISPGEPAIVWLRAEQAISKERFDEAAELLGEWRKANSGADGVVPDVIDRRIGELAVERDGLRTVLVEPKWLLGFGLDFISERAEGSEAFRKLDEVTGSARSMVDDLLGKLGGGGS